ncbi:MAG: YebC/PmpR family DNA-binding transcriptional regulator [Elusimicrobia bacterium]|nr:YebC/PmpR family DNA-binding transcriptional regulator [Elusimicrobiota bacterium]
MGGHSKWANIKHRKAAQDSKKGKVWTKCSREITIAAKIGGGKVESNARLRKAIEDARAVNMPAENVKRAVQKGTGEIPGVVYEELTMEGYGPGGIAIYCEGTTDNRNRTTNEIRRIFENHGGNMGTPGCVAFLFEKRGVIAVPRAAMAEDAFLELALELGAEDVKTDESGYEVLTTQHSFEAVRDGLKAKGLTPESAEVAMLPKTSVTVDRAGAEKNLKVIEALEEHDDVANVYANFDIPDEVLAALEK